MLISFQKKLFSKKILHIVIVFVSSCLTSAGAFDFKNNDGLNKNTLSSNNLFVSKKLLNKETSKVVHNADLLDYVRHNLTLDPIVNQRITTELRWYIKNPNYLKRVFTRAQPFMPYIISELQKNKLPLELALLPIIESAYDSFAYSHGRAAGLWQIIPGTASRFGIKQNWWYDGRRDIVDSTQGALKYLNHLHNLMNNDWLLAIASYNSGEGNILKAIRNNKNRSKSTDFWNLKLSRETTTYVPRFLALVEIIRNPEKYNIKLPSVSKNQQFQEINIDSQLDMALAAKLADIDIDTLYTLNSGLNRWATDPNGPHRILIPTIAKKLFLDRFKDLPKNERVRWHRHQVQSGDTLSEIAEQYHTTVARVISSNKIKNNLIKLGEYLIIPVSTKPIESYSKSKDERRNQAQNKTRKGNRIEHKVVKGESFWSIGKKYKVSTKNLATWNNMSPRDMLSIGKNLVVWSTKPNSLPISNQKEVKRKLTYTVRNGDSLSLIADRFRIKISDLLKWNNLNQTKIIKPGQKLIMHVDIIQQSS